MNGAGRDQEVRMLARRPFVDIFLGGKSRAALLGRPQIRSHVLFIDSFTQAKIDGRIWPHVEHVVTLILRVGLTKLFFNISGQRMNLKGEISAFHCVEKVETDREFRAKLINDTAAQQILRLVMYECQCRQLEFACAESQHQAIFFWYAVEAPRVIRGAIWQVEVTPHPLTAPWTGIEEGDNSKGLLSHFRKCTAKQCAIEHRRLFRQIAIDPEVNSLIEIVLMTVSGTPIQEKCALVKLRWTVVRVSEPEAGYLVITLP